MPAPDPAPAFEQLVSSDRMVHEPARLAVLTALSACQSADFVFLQRLTGLQPGNLSQQLVKLEQAGLIAKGFNGKYPQTTAQITDAGRDAVDEHWKRLDAMRTGGRALAARAPMKIGVSCNRNGDRPDRERLASGQGLQTRRAYKQDET